jgi:CheY-like chemotaxis protein
MDTKLTTILVVDDDRDIRMLVGASLEKMLDTLCLWLPMESKASVCSNNTSPTLRCS